MERRFYPSPISPCCSSLELLSVHLNKFLFVRLLSRSKDPTIISYHWDAQTQSFAPYLAHAAILKPLRALWGPCVRMRTAKGFMLQAGSHIRQPAPLFSSQRIDRAPYSRDGHLAQNQS